MIHLMILIFKHVKIDFIWIKKIKMDKEISINNIMTNSITIYFYELISLTCFFLIPDSKKQCAFDIKLFTYMVVFNGSESNKSEQKIMTLPITKITALKKTLVNLII